ncbi:sodium channel protein Nach-like [Arctopsyche grandis]|uniref:sodium channel protein Nach-like n=1 Tax=Arctopsyche grandis TaxID=121162 RepID=UPI00406D8622
MIRKLRILKNRKPRTRNIFIEIESNNEDGLIILKKSLSAVIKEYLQNSTLAGCKRIVEPGRHPVERWIWFIVICLAISGAVYMVKSVWKDFVQNPTVVSLETDQYPIWKVPFPAIAICNVNKLSKSRIEAFVKDTMINKNKSIESTVSGFRNLGTLIDYNSPNLETFEDFIGFVKENYDIDVETRSIDFKKIMKTLSPLCENMLLRCKWMGNMKNGRKVDKRSPTIEPEKMQKGKRKNAVKIDDDDDDEDDDDIYKSCRFCTLVFLGIWKEKGRNREPLEKPKYLKSAGTLYGLSIVLDPQLDDYVYPAHISQGFKIHVFYTHDYPDQHTGNTVVRFIPVDSRVSINVVARTIRSVPAVKQFSIHQRKCMFKDDLSEKYNGKYSFSDCIFMCKRRIIRALCKCTPFFMPSNINNSCGLLHVPCLYKYKGLFKEYDPEEELDQEPIDGLFCKDCYPDCSSTKYSTKVTAQPLMKNGKEAEILMQVTAKNYSLVHIFFEDVDTELYKLDVVYYWFELLSNLGGICSLFIGLSFVSVFEIVYFLTVRLVDELYKNRFSFSKFLCKIMVSLSSACDITGTVFIARSEKLRFIDQAKRIEQSFYGVILINISPTTCLINTALKQKTSFLLLLT